MTLARLLLPSLLLLPAGHAQSPAPLFGELARAPLPRVDDPSSCVAAGDLNGDGRLDLAVGNVDAPDRLYFGDGVGGFVEAPAGCLPAAADDTRALALADVDGDGDLDLVKGGVGQNRLYLNDGKGTFLEATAGRLPVEEEHTYALGLADVDGDGDLDLVAGNIGQSRLCLNDGKGYFSAAPMPVLASNTRAVALGDVDGDGDWDLVLGSYRESAMLLLNDGQGGFADASAGRLAATCDLAACLADLDGDGDLDLAASGGIFLNDGKGVFSVVQVWPSSLAITVKAIAAGDVDGDLDLDLVLGLIPGGSPPGPGQDRLLLNDGKGFFVTAPPECLPLVKDNTSGLALLDANGDGDLDLVKTVLGFERLYLNDGRGRFVDGFERALPEPPGCAWALARGDLDGDRWPDLATLCMGSSIQIFLDRGWGPMLNATGEKLPVQPPAPLMSLAAADVDRDGRTDLLSGGFNGKLFLHLNQGPGPLRDATASHLPVLPSGLVYGILPVDVDRDGDLDLVLAIPGGQDLLLLNDGTGRFADATAARLPARSTSTATVLGLDADRDSDLDLVFGDPTGDRLYLNDGTGRFTDATAGGLPAGSSEQLLAADVDGDGDTDILAAPTPPGPLRLLLNDGRGRFADASGALPVLTAACLEKGDVDGDGDLDLAVGEVSPYRILMLENDGAGRYRDATSAWLPGGLPGMFGSIALYDRDDDGDLDLFAGSQTVDCNRFFTNLRRQIHAPRRLQPGSPFPLEFWGSPVQVALLLAGTAPGVRDLPPLGTLRIGAPGLFSVGCVPILWGPRVELALRVPLDPAVSGLELRFQALMLDPLVPEASRFTNLLVERGW